ncbi:hypothetical protein DFH94DRAFT_703276 [Russula ochroleuca]|uniref:Uncharacterized protein n=1 Tax=Russula ochroleuca TaxID=152965 RepID=A0A9P5TEG0_9AGAM|nr:hypothetical protein DFH94DRAFT_703276 [Russula ochroleuca]
MVVSSPWRICLRGLFSVGIGALLSVSICLDFPAPAATDTAGSHTAGRLRLLILAMMHSLTTLIGQKAFFQQL